jgi:hypothetical protein
MLCSFCLAAAAAMLVYDKEITRICESVVSLTEKNSGKPVETGTLTVAIASFCWYNEQDSNQPRRIIEKIFRKIFAAGAFPGVFGMYFAVTIFEVPPVRENPT